MRRSRLSNGGMPLLRPNQRARLQTHQGCLHRNTADKENIRTDLQNPQKHSRIAEPPSTTNRGGRAASHRMDPSSVLSPNRTILEYSHNYPCGLHRRCHRNHSLLSRSLLSHRCPTLHNHEPIYSHANASQSHGIADY